MVGNLSSYLWSLVRITVSQNLPLEPVFHLWQHGAGMNTIQNHCSLTRAARITRRGAPNLIPINGAVVPEQSLQPETKLRALRRLLAFALLMVAAAALAELPAHLHGKVQVFTYEGAPAAIIVEKDSLLLDYQWSRVRVDRATLAVKSRLTQADRPDRNDASGQTGKQPPPSGSRVELVGPGIAYTWFDYNAPKPTHVAVAEVTTGGSTWRAMQPTDALQNKYRDPEWTSWTKILRRAAATSYVERITGGQTNRFTPEQGLAGNLVAHLAVAGGTVWAGCVDVYNPETKMWTNGGLCFFDDKQGRWQAAPAIENRRIRFVTGLQAIGDELYVLHREGESMTGDEIAYGMGLYPGDYRPVTSSIMVSRRDKDGKWTCWHRAPVAWEFGPRPRYDAGARAGAATNPPPMSTERAQSVAVDGARLLVYSTVLDFASGNWKAERRGVVSVLDTATGAWTGFDPVKDLSADALTGIHVENGEILVTSNVGVHRWRHPAWDFINTGAVLKNSEVSAVASVGDEVWVGYNKPRFGVFGTQGISRYHEKTGQWLWMSPEDLGTASPVREIVCVKGEAYVLFAPREWMGATMEWNFYAREAALKMPRGLGRFASGKWEFPFKLEGVPVSVPREYTNTTTGAKTIYEEPVQVEHIAVAGGKLLIGTSHGLFEGPAPFKRIREGCVVSMIASADGTGVVAAMAPQRYYRSQEEISIFRYNPATGIGKAEPLPKGSDAWMMRQQIPGEEAPHRPAPWGGGELNFTVTPYADWLWHAGELIRVERAALPVEQGGKP